MLNFTDLISVFIAVAAGAGVFLKLFAEKTITAGIDKALHKEKLLAEVELEFRQRQLEELYGPIYASLRLNEKIYPIWLSGKLQDVNADIIAMFKQQNDEIITILKTKAHLIDGREYPPQFTQFMTSATIWGMYCTRKDEPWIPENVAEIESVKWPTEFEAHIYQKTEELKRRLDELLAKHRMN
jgi:hypothetical protein